AQRADGTEIFDVIDKLSHEIRSDLGVFAAKEEENEDVGEMTTKSPEAYKLYVEGLAAYRENNFAESELILTSAVEIDSTFSQALLYLAMSQGWTESPPYLKARANLTKLKRNSKGLNREETYIVDALYGIVFNDLELTLSTTGSLLKESPDNKWGHYFRAEALFHDGDGDFIEVLEPLENVLYLDPEFKMAYIHIFDVYNIEQLYDRGIVLANRYLQKFPDNYLGYYALGRFYNGNNESTLARRNYEKTIELNPEHRDASFDYLDFLISESDMVAALSLLGKMEKNDSYSNALPRVWGGYADVYTVLKQYDKAYEAYEKSSAYASTVFQKGMNLREQAEIDILLGKVTTGIRKMSISIGLLEDRGRNFGTLIDMVSTLVSHGEYEFALSLTDSMDSYMQSAERKIEQGFLKGLIYLRSGKTESVIKISADIQNLILNEDRKIRSKHLLNILNAEIYSSKGDYQKAIDEYKYIPDDSGLLFKSEILRKLKRYEEALETTKKMQKPERFAYLFEFPLAYYHRGLIYEDMGNAELAVQNYENLLELWKDGDKKLPIRLDASKRLSDLKKNM
ncbi:MAG: tetratricopeptide repeat protein, partial [Candidatus Marinimicrobia bacterium]|nr:tetratricopeptide repeat protein [Candidatus Neomarinimicrobiota bacterium]